MHLSVAPESSDTAPPRRLINGSQTNGLAWVVWRELDDFLFVVSPLRAADAPPAAPIHTSPAEYSTAHKAERAAKAWCAANGPGESVDITGQTNGLDWTTVPGPRAAEYSFHVNGLHLSGRLFATPAMAAEAAVEWCACRSVVGGWLIETSMLDSGGYISDLYDRDSGAEQQADCDGGVYETREASLEAARAWADANPTRAERESRRAAADMDAALAGPDMSTPFDGPGDITTELVIPPDLDAAPALAQLEAEDPEAAKVLVEAVAARDAKLAPPAETPPVPPRDEELEQLRRELALARKERDEAVRGAAADFHEVTAEADDLMELAARKQQLLDDIEDKKLELKSVEKKLTGKGNTVARLVQGIARGERSLAYQQRLAFAASTETREVVGALAEQQVAKLSPRAAARVGAVQEFAQGASTGALIWAFSGVEHLIEHQTTSNPGGTCVTAWIRGHRESTEGFGETLDQAIEATKNMAAIVFADLAPGEAPAEGPPKPAKKAKGPKLRGHDQAAVLATVARTNSTVEASVELGCTPQQLEKFAEKNGVTLKLPEAPAAKAGKARGRKVRGGAA